MSEDLFLVYKNGKKLYYKKEDKETELKKIDHLPEVTIGIKKIVEQLGEYFDKQSIFYDVKIKALCNKDKTIYYLEDQNTKEIKPHNVIGIKNLWRINGDSDQGYILFNDVFNPVQRDKTLSCIWYKSSDNSKGYLFNEIKWDEVIKENDTWKHAEFKWCWNDDHKLYFDDLKTYYLWNDITYNPVKLVSVSSDGKIKYENERELSKYEYNYLLGESVQNDNIKKTLKETLQDIKFCDFFTRTFYLDVKSCYFKKNGEYIKLIKNLDAENIWKDENNKINYLYDGISFCEVSKIDEQWKKIDLNQWWSVEYKLWKDRTKYYLLNGVTYSPVNLISYTNKELYFENEHKKFSIEEYNKIFGKEISKEELNNKIQLLEGKKYFCDFRLKTFFSEDRKQCLKWIEKENKLIALTRQNERDCLWKCADADIYYICDGSVFLEVQRDNIINTDIWRRKDEKIKEIPEDAKFWNIEYKCWGELNKENDVYVNKWVFLWFKDKKMWWDVNNKFLVNDKKSFYILKTGISPVYKLEKLNDRCITDSEMDDLLNGGIAVPRNMFNKWFTKLNEEDKNTQGLIILLTGAPGAGKTTFALELCRRLVEGVPVNQDINISQKKINCIYITNEDDIHNLQAKLDKFNDKKLNILKFTDDVSNQESLYCIDRGKFNAETSFSRIKNNIFKWFKNLFIPQTVISAIRNKNLNLLICYITCAVIALVISCLFTGIFEIAWLPEETWYSKEFIQRMIEMLSLAVIIVFVNYLFSDFSSQVLFDEKIFIENINEECDNNKNIFDNNPCVVVIDSLNSVLKLDKELDDNYNLTLRQRFDLFNKITNKLTKKFPISIILMDTGPGFSPDHKWSSAEYMADLEINFSYDSPENYMIRRLWIVKGRYQGHADGFQRIKIDGVGNMEDENGNKNVETMGKVKQKKYATSYFPEGGIHIFSSIHRYLSEARRDLEKGNENNESIPTPYPALNKAISSDNRPDGGIVPGQCICIIGDRGTMKSHMAYRMILDGLWKNKKGVIISLRDPRDQVYDQLNKIIEKQGLPDAWKKNLQDLIDVLYFWPGYISPDEFLHIVKVAVADEERQYVVINGLEQLPARFPLCAQEKMFISGLLSYLTSRHKIVIVTSSGKIDRPANDGGVPDGLLPMGDIIMQGSVEDIAPKWIWSNSGQYENNIIDKLWSSAVDEKYWKIGDKTYNNLREQFFHKRSQKLEKLQNLLNNKYKQDSITQPHVVYDIVRGATGFRECRMRLLCYVTRGDDRKLAINDILNRKIKKIYSEKILNEVKLNNIDMKMFNKCYKNVLKYLESINYNFITEKHKNDIKKILEYISSFIGDNIVDDSIGKLKDEIGSIPLENQVFLARIPEAITTKIYHSDDVNKTNKQNDSFIETINEAVSKLITAQSEAQQSENRQTTKNGRHKRSSH